MSENVHVLWFVRKPDTPDEEELLIGIYESEADARHAIERLRKQPGFVDAPDGFQINSYELGKDHWTDGFVLDN